MSRHPRLIACASAALFAFGLAACGDSEPSGFTAAGQLPPTEFNSMYPSEEMARETEALIASERDDLSDPRCVPAESLDGVGEFNFDCDAMDPRRGYRYKLSVVVMGSESGEPDLGPVIQSPCDPVDDQGNDLPRLEDCDLSLRPGRFAP